MLGPEVVVTEGFTEKAEENSGAAVELHEASAVVAAYVACVCLVAEHRDVRGEAWGRNGEEPLAGASRGKAGSDWRRPSFASTPLGDKTLMLAAGHACALLPATGSRLPLGEVAEYP